MEHLETSVLGCVLGDGHGFAVFRDLSADTLTDSQLEAVNDFVVRVLRSAQGEVIPFADINEAGVASHHRGSKFDDSLEVLVKRIVGSNAAAYIVQEINIDVIVQRIGTHTSTYRQHTVMSKRTFQCE
jgi:hypothetical protein